MKKTTIAHYGVPGMRWGVRNASSGSDVKSLSNKELQDRITRMNLERNYTKLTEQPSLLNRGAKTVGSIIGNAAKQTLTNMLAKQMGVAVDGALAGVLDTE